jgi:hypothetical protein
MGIDQLVFLEHATWLAWRLVQKHPLRLQRPIKRISRFLLKEGPELALVYDTSVGSVPRGYTAGDTKVLRFSILTTE